MSRIDKPQAPELFGLMRKLAALPLAQMRRTYVRMRLDDPSCPRVCRMLQQLQYPFLRVLPNFSNHDWAALRRGRPRTEQSVRLYSGRGRDLWSYIQDRGSPISGGAVLIPAFQGRLRRRRLGNSPCSCEKA